MELKCSDGVYPDVLKGIIKFLGNRELFDDVFIYCDNKRYSKGDDDDPVIEGINVHIEDDIDVACYLQYYNDDTLSMSFEGPFYEALQGYYGWDIHEAFYDMLASYGYWYEQGTYIDLTLYKL